MRSGFAPRGGFVLMKSPSQRQEALRRRAVVACAFLALAIASGVIGSLTGSTAANRPTPAFSYFPSE